MFRFALMAIALLMATPADAVLPSEMLKDPAMEARAREVGKDLRCLVCQNQSIDDSDAELARDLRVLVRERITAGDSNEEVIEYVVSRYGDFVLLDPPFKAKTYVLWFGPVAIFIGGALIIFTFYRRRSDRSVAVSGAQPLSDAEQQRLADLMDKNK